MSNKYELIIPSKTKDGTFLNVKTVKKLVADEMITLFGGVTFIKGKGFWKNKNGKIQSENVVTAYSYTIEYKLSEMQLLALKVKNLTDNEKVALIVNNEIQFI